MTSWVGGWKGKEKKEKLKKANLAPSVSAEANKESAWLLIEQEVFFFF